MRALTSFTRCFIILLIMMCSCSKNRNVILNEDIRLISSPNSLRVVYSGGQPKTLSARKGKKLADIQAKEWDSNPKLIMVYNSAWGGKKLKPCEWIYIYKNENKNAWLAVCVKSGKIIDAGYRPLYDNELKDWPSIDLWKVESHNIDKYNVREEYVDMGTYTKYVRYTAIFIWNGSYYLRSIIQGSSKIPIWSRNVIPDPYIKTHTIHMNANTGEAIKDVYIINNKFGNRKSLW